MGNVWVRVSSGIQLWLINHPNCITNLILNFLYAIDVIAYSITGPLNFLSRRSNIFGPNFAALGRIVVGEYDKCAEIISSPQQRSTLLGRAKLYPNRLPKYFPLFLSDAEVARNGDDTHARIHKHLWENFIPPAFDRLQNPAFATYIKHAATLLKKNKRLSVTKANKIINEMTLKCIFHSILGLELTDSQLEKAYDLFFKSGFSSYVTGALKPHAGIIGCFQGTRNENINELTDLVEGSLALHNYTPYNGTANMNKRQFAEMTLAIVGIAGCLGTSNLCKQVFFGIPQDYAIDLNDKKEILLAILEAARIKSPVNNVNTILVKDFLVNIKGKDYKLPPGTMVAGSIGLASVDPAKFENPRKFNPNRHNLMSATLSFNHVGFSQVGSGTRQCPGRNIAVKLASDFLIQLRNDYNPPEQSRTK